MEPGIAAAAYAAESVVEGAVAATVAIAQPTMPIKAQFTRIADNNALPRSSHSLSVVKGRAYIFGGEVRPREPVDNSMHVFTLPSSSVAEADYKCIPGNASNSPPPRVGHTSVNIGDRIYVWGGRGGKDMAPLEEAGRIWVFDTLSNSWSYLDPVEGSYHPEARSYHASTASEHPLPGTKADSADSAAAAGLDDYGTIFVHGGCPTSGRLADVWSFDVAARFWSKLPDAPGSPRGGASLAIARNRLYRFGGFDGNELGGQIDYLEITKQTFDDKGGRGELSLALKSGKWQTVSIDSPQQGPGNRSVAGLHPITTGQGRNYLCLIFGEKDPASDGHNNAGTFWGDVWTYQLRPEGMTAASFKDATRLLVGAKTSEGTWAKVDVPSSNVEESSADVAAPRGWFASARCEDMDNSSIVLWGGLNSDNERLGDGWLLTFNT